jgi:AcrR family transcriptional regulator
VRTRKRAPRKRPTRRDAVETRARLFAAAGHAFAERGYGGASIREICAAAGVNLAAVRHYFGSKAELYREVLLESHRELRDSEPVPSFTPGDDPEDGLRRFVEYALRLMLVRRARHPFAGQLIARELREPTPILDDLVQLVMRPVRDELERIVGALLADADNPRLRGQCTNMVLGLCVFHEQAREVLTCFGYPPPTQESEVPRLAHVMLPFMLGGIARCRKLAMTQT